MYGHARYSGDYLRQNRFLDVCGADHLGKGIGSLNIKFTACGAHSYGKERSAVEVFAGCGWDMTFEEYIRMITWMFQQGMQIIINHGFFYSDRGARKNDWPPSQFFQWKGWDRQSEGNDMIRRLYYAMTDGINESDILVYFPLESFWYHYIPDQNHTHGFFHGPFLEDEKAKEIDSRIQLLLNGFLSANMDFDLLHKDALENFDVQGGKIINTKSGQSFSVLVLPECSVLPVEAAKLLLRFAECGGKLAVSGEMPCMGMHENEDDEVREIMDRIARTGCMEFFEHGTENEMHKFINKNIPHPVLITAGRNGTVNNHPSYPAYLIDPYMHGGENLDGVMFTRYLKEVKRNTLFMNYGSKPETIETIIRTAGAVPEIWDTFTGEIHSAEVLEKGEDYYRICIQLPCNYGILVVSDQ